MGSGRLSSRPNLVAVLAFHSRHGVCELGHKAFRTPSSFAKGFVIPIWTLHGEGKNVGPGEVVAPGERLGRGRTVDWWLQERSPVTSVRRRPLSSVSPFLSCWFSATPSCGPSTPSPVHSRTPATVCFRYRQRGGRLPHDDARREHRCHGGPQACSTAAYMIARRHRARHHRRDRDVPPSAGSWGPGTLNRTGRSPAGGRAQHRGRMRQMTKGNSPWRSSRDAKLNVCQV